MSRESECEIEELRMKVQVLRRDHDEGLSELDGNLVIALEAIEELESRGKALEVLINSQFAPDTAGHPHDGGWFD